MSALFKKVNGYTIYLSVLLGQGAYGKVYKSTKDDTHQQCAVKVIRKQLMKSDSYLKSALLSQIKILKSIKSNNIVRVFDVMESSENFYIFQELCESDLEKYLGKAGRLKEPEAIEFLKQICNGFIAMIREGIVHRDLKPANILLAKDEVKIADFGFAKKNSTNKIKNETSVGTPMYMSLEILKAQKYTSKCDIWAIGLIFYEMLHGDLPWNPNSEFELISMIEKKPIIYKSNLTKQTKDFLVQTLKINEKDRINWDQLFVHPIFGGHFSKHIEKNKKFQNELGMFLSDLRFKINSNNINLKNLLKSLEIDQNKQMSFKQFHVFIKHINPNIEKDEAFYFFEKIDINEDGMVSVAELSKLMEKHHISLESLFCQSLEFLAKKTFSNKEQFQINKIASQIQIKAKKCFIKLNKILASKKASLKQTFKAYDSDKNGELTIQQFSKIMKKLDATFTDDQLSSIFEYIDINHSKTIEFNELNSYYLKVNGIPPTLDLLMNV